MMRVRRELLNALLILSGILSAGMGIKGFLLSSGHVRDIDPDAFIVYHALAGVEGGVVKTRGFH